MIILAPFQPKHYDIPLATTLPDITIRPLSILIVKLWPSIDLCHTLLQGIVFLAKPCSTLHFYFSISVCSSESSDIR